MRSNRSDSSLIVKILRNTVLVLFLIIFVSIVYNFRNRENVTESALMADATASRTFKGVFIRNESIVTYSGSGVLSYSVADGGKLGNGSVIAKAYPTDEQISINREISRLEKELEILKKIENPGTQESAQPANLSASIEENFQSLIYARDMEDYDALNAGLDTLLVQMSTYQLITSEVSSFQQQIIEISTQLDELKARSVDPTEVVRSDRSAYFASYTDGYEEKLTPESINTITVSDINDITDKKRANDGVVVGKLIDGYNWYLAGVIDNSRKEYAIGETVRLKFESSAETYSADIVDIRDEGDKKQSIIILSCSQFNCELVQHRAENVEIIKGSYRGLKVPREAIRFKDMEVTAKDENGGEHTTTESFKGVYILKGEQIEFKKIDVIYEGSGYVLSAVHDEDKSYLSLYDDIIIEGVDQVGK
ncbi:MAG: hypothetical protein IKQ90_07615 [Ruminococcus sp.]|nr:hypothetical protein [Ruminococcus sp.]